ncbi:MAG: TlpA disulfide reductase family protein [Pseudomonadota bacterium]
MQKTLLLLTASVTFALGSEQLMLSPNKTYVLDFFASWCSSCEKEIPILSKIEPKLKSRNIEVIGIDVDKNPNDAKKFQQKLKKYFTFYVVDDSSNKIISQYKPMGMPAIYIVKNGQNCGKIFGAVPDLEIKIEEQLRLCEGK